MRQSLLNHLIVAFLRTIVAVILLLLVGIASLRWLPPPTTSFMLQSPVKPVRHVWVPRSRIAAFAGEAVIASEDQKFRQHHGFDLDAMQQAYEQNQKKHHRKRGASTISQQTAKNLFLWPGGGYARKGIEAALTSLIELLWDKDRILEVYLNIAEFGPGVYGVEAASQAFFSKPAAALSAAEAARLAAVLPNPRLWNARNPGPYVQRRATWIMGQMGYGPRNAPADEPEPQAPSAGTEATPVENVPTGEPTPEMPPAPRGEPDPAMISAPQAAPLSSPSQ